jgi:hypothetical protein
VFPDPAGQVTLTPDNRVTMPLDYWQAVARYVVAMERNRKIVEAAEGE